MVGLYFTSLDVKKCIEIIKGPLYLSFNFSTEIGIFKKINGHETSWALGAALDLLSKLR